MSIRPIVLVKKTSKYQKDNVIQKEMTKSIGQKPQ
jgi:hypothetical protein